MAFFRYVEPGQATMRVSVWGNVEAPGRYEVQAGTDMLELLSLAGGPSDRLRRSNERYRTTVVLSRKTETALSVVFEAPLADLSTGLTPYPGLQDEDLLNVETVIEGLGWNPQSPGKVEFDIDGETFELEAYTSGDDLFFVFGDQTSGRETYPAGRFLYAAWPEDGGTTILDFNRAYNPPCAFNDFATCPVASPQNRLATRIEAGEKYDPKVHATPDLH